MFYPLSTTCKAFDDWRGSETFSAEERIALEYAEGISALPVSVTDGLMAELKKCFSDDQIVELTALIAFQNMSAKFNAALDIPSQGLCRGP